MKPSALPPEIDQAFRDEIVEFEALAEEAADMAADSVTETAKVAALRVRLTAKTRASEIRIERARAAMNDRLANRRAAATAARDPRDEFDDLGTAASSEFNVAGDN